MNNLVKLLIGLASCAIIGLGLGAAYLQVAQPVEPTPDDYEGTHMSPLGILTVPPLAVAWLWHRFITRTHDFTRQRGIAR